MIETMTAPANNGQATQPNKEGSIVARMWALDRKTNAYTILAEEREFRCEGDAQLRALALNWACEII